MKSFVKKLMEFNGVLWCLNRTLLYVMVIFLLTPNVILASPTDKPSWAKGQILVQPQSGLSNSNFNNILKRYKASSKGRLNKLKTHLITVPEQAEQAVVKALSKNPHIEFAELNLRVKPDEITANDPYFPNAWHLTKMKLPLAWENSMGYGVVVAILDSGVNSNHTDLSGNVINGWNSVSQNQETSDINGHGTKVAGVVAAIGDNSTGVTSIAWHASIMPIRITNDSSGYAYWSDVANGLTWAADNGADIANISYKVSTSSTVTNAAQYMRNKGGLVVASAGNGGADLNCNDNPNIITVSATDSADNKASWSDYGNCIDVAAPGVGIWTTANNGGYTAVNGTSFASPAVAATLALIKSVNTNLPVDDIESILKLSADNSKAGGIYSIYYGHGRVDASEAVSIAGESLVMDHEPPNVEIIHPEENSVQSNTISIEATAQDNTSVSLVEIYANGTLIGTDNIAPYTVSFDSTTVLDGDIAITATAYDPSGNRAYTASHWLKIDNITEVPDTTAPHVNIVNLTEGSVISGTQSIQISASDDIGVQRIELYIDGTLKSQTTDAVLLYNWNTRKASGGSHTILAKAFDSAANQADDVINVTIGAKKKGRK